MIEPEFHADLQDTLAVLQEVQYTKIRKRVMSIMMNAATLDGAPPWRIGNIKKMEHARSQNRNHRRVLRQCLDLLLLQRNSEIDQGQILVI